MMSLKKQITFATLLLSISFFSFGQTSNWSNHLNKRCFTQNIGQYGNEYPSKEEFPYCAQFESGYAFFSSNRIILSQVIMDSVNSKSEEFSTEKESEKKKYQIHEQVIELKNSGLGKINGIEELSSINYFSTFPDTPLKGFKKLIFENAFPLIDIEFSLPSAGGLKYTIYVHPGGDPNSIKFLHEGADIYIDNNGSLHFKKDQIEYTDHAPTAFLQGSLKEIPAAFSLREGHLDFSIGDYPKEEMLIIDPWIVTPINSVDNVGLKVDYDYAGNVYLHGGVIAGSGFMGDLVSKFDPNGNLLWTWNHVGATDYGDLSCNRENGDVYITSGHVDGTADIVQISTNGTLVNQYGVDAMLDEIGELWRCSYDHCNDQLIIGAGLSIGLNAGSGGITSARIDQNLTMLEGVNSLGMQFGEFQDVSLLEIDEWDSCAYLVVSDNGSSFGNYLYKTSLPDFATTEYQVPSGYNFFECGHATFHNYSNGFNGIAVNQEFLYTFDGKTLKQWNKATGTQNNQIVLNFTEYTHAGIDTDLCGNIYVSGSNEIQIYDNGLNLINSIPANNTIYDVRVGSGNQFFVTGNNFIQSFDLIGTSLIQAVGDSCTGDFSLQGCPAIIDSLEVNWSPSGNVGPVVTGLAPGWHTYTISKGCNTVVVDSVFVTNSCELTLTTVNDTICLGECVEIYAEVSGNYSAPVSYQWDNGITDTDSTTIVCPLVSTTYTVIATDNAGDADTAQIEITVIPVPNVDLGNDTTLCTPPHQLDIQNPGLSYLWSDNSTNQTLSVTSSGLYWAEAFIGNCSDRDSINIVFDTLNLDLGPDLETCLPDTITLDAGNLAVDYLWNDGNTNQVLNVLGIGQYFVEITSNAGCMVYDTINITSATITANLPNDTSFCIGGSILLDPGNPGATFLWSDNTNLQHLTVNTQGTYWVEVTQGICQSSDTINIEVQNLIASLLASDTAGCAPLSVNFTDLSSINTGSIHYWSWDFGDGNTSNLSNPSHTYQQGGNYSVQLTIQSNIACTDDTTVNQYIVAHPTAEAIAFQNGSVINGNPVNFQNQSINANSWFWDFGDGNTTTEESPSHIYDEAGNYTVVLIASNENGCDDTTSFTLVVESEILLFAPNAFTPDNDEHNHYWQYYISGMSEANFSVQIFNRWGELIWESTTPNEPWDGTYKGKLVQDGVYTWKMQCASSFNDDKKLFIGHINMLK